MSVKFLIIQIPLVIYKLINMEKMHIAYDPMTLNENTEYERATINRSYICSYICTLILASFQQGYAISELNSVLTQMLEVFHIATKHQVTLTIYMSIIVPSGAAIGSFFICFLVTS